MLVCYLMFYLLYPSTSASSVWTWKCEKYKCLKYPLMPNEIPVDSNVCNLLCGKYSTIWPQPTGKFEMQRKVSEINLDHEYNGASSNDLDLIMQRFRVLLDKSSINTNYSTSDAVAKTRLYFEIEDTSKIKLQLDSDECYLLHVSAPANEDKVAITIKANNLLGARHGLETLLQVIVFDHNANVYVIPKTLIVHDAPRYTIRGVMLDTARHFMHVNTIKRIIDGMAMNKLNTFHWHLTDTQSFPFEAKSLLNVTRLGSYSQREIYTVKNIQDIVEWARIRGVRILPEFDGPAHVGEGWQNSGLTVCFNKKPWDKYCKEPPCGQFDPTKDELYSTLQMLFKDIIEAFDPDLFHFGGDEVNFNCWKSVPSINDWMIQQGWTVNTIGFVKLWSYYQNKAHEAFMTERRLDIPAVVWSSTLTDKEHLHHLPKEKYIIHLWTSQNDKIITHLMKKDYRIIFSNYDALYLDCGFSSWTEPGNNWCSPFIGWKEIYQHSPRRIVERFAVDGKKTSLILGSIAALWTETVSDASAEMRIWPRACALAERVWTEPDTHWNEAEDRLTSHCLRMNRFGIRSEAIVPRWCHQNQGSCQNWRYPGNFDFTESNAAMHQGLSTFNFWSILCLMIVFIQNFFLLENLVNDYN